MAIAKVIRKLITQWGFDVDVKPLAESKKQVKSLKVEAAKTIAVIGGLATGLTALALSTASDADEVGKAARNYGLTAQSLRELHFAAQLAGVTNEQLQSSFKDITIKAIEAQKGNKELASVYKQLNINVKDFIELPTDQKLEAIADGLADVDDPGQRAYLRMKAMGEVGAFMGNMLDGGSESIRNTREEFRALGGVVSQDVIEQAEQLNDNMDKTKLLFKGIKEQLGFELIPLFLEASKETLGWVRQNRELVKTKIKDWIVGIAAGVRIGMKWVKMFVGIIDSMIERLGGLEQTLRIVEFLLAAFVGFKVISGVLMLVNAVGALAAGFTLAGNAAFLAQAKALLLPIAVGLFIAMLAYAYDDLQNFLDGNNSVIGELSKKWPGLGEVIRDIFQKGGPVQTELEDFFSFWIENYDKAEAKNWEFGETLKGQWAEFKTNLKDDLEELFGDAERANEVWERLTTGLQYAWGRFMMFAKDETAELVEFFTSKFSFVLDKLIATAQFMPGLEVKSLKMLKMEVDSLSSGASLLTAGLPQGSRSASLTRGDTIIQQLPGEDAEGLAERIKEQAREELEALSALIFEDSIGPVDY